MQTREIIRQLEVAKNYQEIRSVMGKIKEAELSLHWHKNLKEKELRKICSLVQDRVIECIVERGERPRYDILWCYGIFQEYLKIQEKQEKSTKNKRTQKMSGANALQKLRERES